MGWIHKNCATIYNILWVMPVQYIPNTRTGIFPIGPLIDSKFGSFHTFFSHGRCSPSTRQNRRQDGQYYVPQSFNRKNRIPGRGIRLSGWGTRLFGRGIPDEPPSRKPDAFGQNSGNIGRGERKVQNDPNLGSISGPIRCIEVTPWGVENRGTLFIGRRKSISF